MTSWRRANSQQAAEHDRRYRAKHLEEEAERGRRYRERNKDRIAERKRLWHEKNRALVAARRRRRYEGHRAEEIEAARRRQALKARAPGSHTQAEWLLLVTIYEGRCAYCGADRKLERDHVVPLTRGGSDSIDNIVPACRSCNSSKGDRLPLEWRIRPARKENDGTDTTTPGREGD